MATARTTIAGLAALAVAGAIAPSALAGGWAATTLDPIASPLKPGATVPIGYTVRQHGVTPVTIPGTGIEIRSAEGARRFFPGRRKGAVGHYVARIVVPRRGATWTARQGPFAPQPLGPVPVGGRPAPIALGRAVFQAKGCVACHAGPGGLGAGGIDLAGVGSRVPGLTRAAYLRQSITTPSAVIGASAPFPMPKLALTPSELDAVVSYLMSTPET